MRWARATTALWRRTPAHVVVAGEPGGEVQVLSGPARDVWDALDVATAERELVARHGPQVTALLHQLAAAGLLGRSEAGGDGPPPAGPPAPAVIEDARQDRAQPMEVLAAALTFWLPPGAGRIREEPLEAAAWADVILAARRERCLGPLCWAVGTGALPATEEQRDEAERYAILGARTAVAREGELVEVVTWLAQAGVAVRALKGTATAHLDHIDPSFRASADHDLLIRPAAIDGAVEVLAEHGYVRELPERRRGFDARFEKDITLQQHGRHEVDLHRLPIAGAFGMSLDLHALWAEPDAFELAGRTIQALDATGRFVHAAWSLALTDPEPRLVPALDMVAIANAHPIDDARLDALAPIGRGRGALTRAVDLCRSLLGPAAEDLPEVLGPSPGETRRERARLRTYPGQGGTKAHLLLGAAWEVRGARDRLRYLWALARPSAEHRRARRARDRRPEWQIAVGHLRGGRRPAP